MKHFSHKIFDSSKLNPYFCACQNTTSLHSAALRRLYSAKSRYCPDQPAQTLFDLLNWRDFAISQPIGTDKKALRSGARRVFKRPRRDILEATQPSVCSVFNSLYNNRLRYFKKLRQGCRPRTRSPRRSACRFRFLAIREKFRRSRPRILT